MNNTTVTIYEFSDRIQYDYDNGELLFHGDDTGFINSTIDSIPSEIEKAIADGYFKLKCSKSNNDPAFVGRLVHGGNSNSILVCNCHC